MNKMAGKDAGGKPVKQKKKKKSSGSGLGGNGVLDTRTRKLLIGCCGIVLLFTNVITIIIVLETLLWAENVELERAKTGNGV